MRLHKGARYFLVALAFFLAETAAAQAPAGTATPRKGEQQEHGVTLSESFEGSSNADGQAMDLTSAAGYVFNKHFSWDLGIPIFFTRGTTSTGTQVSNSGPRDIFTNFRLTFKNPAVNYVTTRTGPAPSCDTKKGLSTGRATFDWGNNFSPEFGTFTPFTNLSVAHSLFNTPFFHRPFRT